jgi:cysteine synthase A
MSRAVESSSNPHRVGILAAVGNTPLVHLTRLFPECRAQVFAKLEFLNPGGSAKDRSALAMLGGALARGEIRPGDTVIESSSGNMAIGLAQATKLLGLKLACVVDRKTSTANLRLLRAYGVQMEMVEAPHPDTGSWLDARIRRVQTLLEAIPGAWWSNQYNNEDNARGHAQGTAAEVAKALGCPPTHVLAAASTCGTLGGFVDWRTATGAKTEIIAVDVIGSNLFDAPPGDRLIPGIGSSMTPQLVDPALLSVEIVDDADCVAGCHLLLEREAIIAGGSSGGLVAALSRIAPSLSETDRVVVLLMDRGERYLETIYDREWVEAHIRRPLVFSPRF